MDDFFPQGHIGMSFSGMEEHDTIYRFKSYLDCRGLVTGLTLGRSSAAAAVPGITSEEPRSRGGTRSNRELAEWLMAPVLKTGKCNSFWGSNP